MPVWVNLEDETDYLVIESIAELKELAGGDAKLDDLHRPFIDEVVIQKDGKTYKRVEEVLDCWFESGSMPIAQAHYPFSNTQKFEQSFPANYIGEGLDQTRLWFYVLHVMATIIFDKPAYKNVLVNGMIMAADGQKLSKRLKNYPPVSSVFNNEGADTLRLYLLSNYQAVAGDYMRFNREAMKDINRNVLGTLLNTQRFFKMYTDIDSWRPPQTLALPTASHVLDIWLLARLAETTKLVSGAADSYKLAYAIQPIFGLIDDLSNWYVRRSRRRFWKSESDSDKNQAYEILWYALLRTCQLLAPWAPFISDQIWRELTVNTGLPNSVHLSDWPEEQAFDQGVIDAMKQTRLIVEHGLAARMFNGGDESQVKVRQPLRGLTYTGKPLGSELEAIIAEEVNIKAVKNVTTDNGEVFKVEVDKTVTPELKREGLAREIVRNVQIARKQAGLNVEDRIQLYISTESVELQQAITEHKATIMAETLATEFSVPADGFNLTVKVEGQEITVQLKKSA